MLTGAKVAQYLSEMVGEDILLEEVNQTTAIANLTTHAYSEVNKSAA